MIKIDEYVKFTISLLKWQCYEWTNHTQQTNKHTHIIIDIDYNWG